MEVTLDDVSRRFDDTEVLRHVTTQIPRSRKVALVGPNGSGKSTLTRIIMGMLHCEGRVTLDGKSPFENRVEIARHLAYVPQAPPQLSVSVSTLLRTVSTLRGQPESDFLTLSTRLQLDFATIADRPMRSLSAGMKQKMLIALAFASKPSLLILDEPTASLDPVARARFYECFREIADHTTLILCSHRVEEIQHLVDHVIVLEAGTIAFDGPLSDFIKGKANAVIEVDASEEASEWLHQNGFMRNGPSFWSKVLPSEEKVLMARTIFENLDGQMGNIRIRDLDVLTIPTQKDEG